MTLLSGEACRELGVWGGGGGGGGGSSIIRGEVDGFDASPLPDETLLIGHFSVDLFNIIQK